MQRLRLSLRPDGVALHPIGDVFLANEGVERAEAWTWNVAEQPVTLLFLVRGDRGVVEDAVAETDVVLDYEVVPVDEDTFYFYVVDEPPALAMEVFRALDRSGTVAVPPVSYRDGEVRMTLLGDPPTLQAIVEALPDSVNARVEGVGTDVAPVTTPLSACSERQREAIRAGVAVGYYDVPRTADHEDVAAALGCAPSTAAEHLQKAEARIARYLVSER